MSGAAMARFGAKRGVRPPSRWPRCCRQRELDLNSLVLLVGQAVPGEFIDKYVFPNGALPHISGALLAMQQGGLASSITRIARKDA